VATVLTVLAWRHFRRKSSQVLLETIETTDAAGSGDHVPADRENETSGMRSAS
jgi:hypothetical protein